jgi:hypothetical protein
MRGACAVLLLVLGLAGPARADAPVSTTAQLEFHSSFWLNLHHTLFAAAWARRPNTDQRRLVGALPSPLIGPLSDEERAAWDAAVAYYDRELADRDLRTGKGMTSIKLSLAAETLSGEAIGPEPRAVLDRAAPVYRRHFWPAHDRSNREWIRATSEHLRSIERDLVTSHERLYARPWFASPVRVDVVWVGRAYTTLDPFTHATVSPAEGAGLTGWTGVEITVHEVCHELILPTEAALAEAFGDRARQHGGLWHVVQFYQTGAALQQILRARDIDYTPYMYSTGLFDRAWSQYRKPVEDAWGPYVRGEISRAVAIERLVAAVTPR